MKKEIPIGSYQFLVIITCAVVLNSSDTHGEACPLFVAAPTFPVGVSPYSVAVGDFNGDGKPDLAVANKGSDYVDNGSVSVLLGKGDGSFEPARNFAAGISPSSVAVGDFNGDSLPDLAVANARSDYLSVLLGNGDGTFQAISINTGRSSSSVVVADFDGDGKLDLAMAHPDYGTTSLLLGNGDGTFRSGASTFGGRFLTVGDFDGDSHPDLASVTDAGVWVILGKGDGSFKDAGQFTTGANPQSLAVADFNADGKPDLATANADSSKVSVLMGNGDGTFQPAIHYYDASTSAATSISVADFNGDGMADVTVAIGPGNVLLMLGNGDGSFQPAIDYAAGGIGPRSLACSDLNADGRPDLVVANSRTENVSVLLGNADGTLQAARNFSAASSALSVAVADFNRDSRLDLAVADFYYNRVSVLFGTDASSTSSEFAAGNYVAVGIYPKSVTVGDFNLDGAPDLAVANSGSGDVSVALGNGDGTFQHASNLSLGSYVSVVTVGDFNNDSCPDLAVLGAANQSSIGWVLLGKGDGTFLDPRAFAGVNYSTALAVGDFNGDAHPDLAEAGSAGNGVRVLLGNGDGSFASAKEIISGHSWDVAVGDFNGDSRLDLAVANNPGPLLVLLGNGDGTFQSAVDYLVGGGAGGGSLAVSDFNADGWLDLATANDSGAKAISVLLGVGDGTFEAALIYSAGVGALSLAAGDFNADGKPDLATANSSGQVSVVLAKTCNLAPEVRCKDVIVSASANCSANVSIDDGSWDPDAGDSISLAQAPAGPYPLGRTTVTLTVTDNRGASASCTAIVTVNDTTPPLITADPPPQTLHVDANCQAAVPDLTDAVVASDCNGPLAITQRPPAGTFIGLGTSEVTLTVRDQANNASVSTTILTVEDKEAPTIVCPPGLVVDATSPLGAVVTFASPSVSDNCSAATVSCSPASGSTFSIGTTLVTCTAADGSGNTSACSFTVRVKSAAEQIGDLSALIQTLPIEPGLSMALKAKVQAALAAINASNPQAACGELKAFLNQVSAQAGKKLSVQQAEQLTNAATRIRGAVGC